VRADCNSVGETLLRGALDSARNATGHAAAGDDRITLDADAAQFAGMTREDAIDRWIFSGNRNLVRDVDVAGVRVVTQGRHRDRDAVAARYRAAMSTLLA
jgi:formimidoylglutamate deiminase